jgi:hypothetical protein
LGFLRQQNKKNDVDCENVGWVEQQRNPTQLEGVCLRMLGFLRQQNKKMMLIVKM